MSVCNIVCRLSGSLLHRLRNNSVSPVACVDDKLFTGGGEKQLGKKQRGCNLRKAFTYFFVTPSDYDYTKKKGIPLPRFIEPGWSNPRSS